MANSIERLADDAEKRLIRAQLKYGNQDFDWPRRPRYNRGAESSIFRLNSGREGIISTDNSAEIQQYIAELNNETQHLTHTGTPVVSGVDDSSKEAKEMLRVVQNKNYQSNKTFKERLLTVTLPKLGLKLPIPLFLFSAILWMIVVVARGDLHGTAVIQFVMMELMFSVTGFLYFFKKSDFLKKLFKYLIGLGVIALIITYIIIVIISL